EAQQITDVKTGVTSFKWSPDGKWLAFTAMDGPSAAEEKAIKEKYDAYVVDENVKMSRLYVIPVEAPAKGKRAARLLTNGNYSVGGDDGRTTRTAYDWSPDGKPIVFAHVRTPAPDDWPSADLSLVEVSSATVRPLVHTAAAEHSPLFSPDGQRIAFVAS